MADERARLCSTQCTGFNRNQETALPPGPTGRNCRAARGAGRVAMRRCHHRPCVEITRLPDGGCRRHRPAASTGKHRLTVRWQKRHKKTATPRPCPLRPLVPHLPRSEQAQARVCGQPTAVHLPLASHLEPPSFIPAEARASSRRHQARPSSSRFLRDPPRSAAAPATAEVTLRPHSPVPRISPFSCRLTAYGTSHPRTDSGIDTDMPS